MMQVMLDNTPVPRMGAPSEVADLAWGSFVYFTDPDGNAWALQQLPAWSKGAGGTGERPEA